MKTFDFDKVDEYGYCWHISIPIDKIRESEKLREELTQYGYDIEKILKSL